MIEEPREYTDCPDPLNQIAYKHFGVPYLYPYQRLVISNILDATSEESAGEIRGQIVILPTGSGKSLCFSLPALLLPHPTLVVFPLLALMADQARRLTHAGIDVCILKGGQTHSERDAILTGLESGKTKLIISNPETLIAGGITERLHTIGISHLVVDETHTVSEWGDTFRPAYLEVGKIAKTLGNPLITAFTATASEHIIERIREIIFEGEAPRIVAGNPDRPNIRYRIIPVLSKEHEIERLARTEKRPAIIFCRSRDGAELTARFLRIRLHEDQIKFYHAGLSREEKKAVEEWFFSSDTGILCATCAYGMGVDKANIRTVIHRDVPPSVESYLQESGRGGRDGLDTEAILLHSREDAEHGEKLQEEVARKRYEAVLEITRRNDLCRRAFLLSLLKAAPEACFGCDVCDGTVVSVPPGYREIVGMVKRFPRRYGEKELVIVLSGSRGNSMSQIERRFCSDEKKLKDWSEEDVEAAIRELEHQSVIRILKRGPFSGRSVPAVEKYRYQKDGERL